MTRTLAPLAPVAPAAAPRSSASRCYGQATILMRRGGGLTTADAALVTAYLPGTSTPYPDALYGGPDASEPLAFPVATGGDGVVALWADAPGRLELEAVHPVLGRARGVLDLEPDPDAAPEAVDAYTKTESDARYPLKTDGDPYPAYLTQPEGDARYPLKTDPDPYPQYLTTGEVPAVDVTVTGDNGVGVTESPANTFALATKVSPDAANALALRANGLYATDTAGITAGYWQAGAGTTPKLTVQATAPTSPATGDLWIW